MLPSGFLNLNEKCSLVLLGNGIFWLELNYTN
ncbi:unknown protein [Parachlamydia acanthamoebae UV-7]|uniref:Uncharacterized protein n=1 Tax=Parachlamydia acanthamoebae (strain UV7) TaxID=765952 RepID=F8KXY5_PARAV|nr:unknown protein [Parachlamydia acanthamoebae UV-7]